MDRWQYDSIEKFSGATWNQKAICCRCTTNTYFISFYLFLLRFFFHSWLSNIANTKKQHNKFPNTINIYPLLQQPSINKGTINHLVADDIRITIKLNQKWYVNFLSESDFGGFCHSRLFSRKFLTYTTEIGRITFNDRLLKQWQIFHLW